MRNRYAPRLVIAQNREAVAYMGIRTPRECPRIQSLTMQAAKPNINILCPCRHTPVAGVDLN